MTKKHQIKNLQIRTNRLIGMVKNDMPEVLISWEIDLIEDRLNGMREMFCDGCKQEAIYNLRAFAKDHETAYENWKERQKEKALQYFKEHIDNAPKP